jgi:transcriptional regulator with GAF, ATPase, and Fis domain
MNEALLLGSVRQHELTDAANSWNARLQAEIIERNVIERAVILARGGPLTFELPTGHTQPVASSVKPHVESTTGEQFMTEAQIRQHERDNLVMVLEKAGWKIKGPNGAAELLGISPGTLTARIRKMGLKRTTVQKSQWTLGSNKNAR